MNLPESHITVSVVVYLVQEVSTCLVFPPTIQRGKVVSLEKKEQEESCKLDVWMKEPRLGEQSLQILHGCEISSCSMFYWPLILV